MSGGQRTALLCRLGVHRWYDCKPMLGGAFCSRCGKEKGE